MNCDLKFGQRYFDHSKGLGLYFLKNYTLTMFCLFVWFFVCFVCSSLNLGVFLFFFFGCPRGIWSSQARGQVLATVASYPAAAVAPDP